MSDSLRAAARAAALRKQADARFIAALRQAHADGHSLRAIAKAVGLTHVRVHQLLRG